MTKTASTANQFLKTASIAAIAAVSAALITAPAFADDYTSGASVEESYGEARMGPKKSVAVVDFGATGSFLYQYGQWEAGGGLAAMLETELAQTNQFRLAQRSHLDAALYEQQLSESGLTAAPTARSGQLVGAQYLVRANVTDFTLSEKGGGLSIGGNIGGVLGGISPQTRKGRISIDFQIFDSTSGEIVDSFSVTEKVKSKSIAVSASKSGLNVGGNTFKNTPLGQAARNAITEAADRISDALRNKSWSAHVAQASASTLFVNVGADAGLNPGDTLKIYRIVEQINDPITGAILGVEKAEIGSATVSSVAEQYAKASFSAVTMPEAGDILTFTNTQLAQFGGAGRTE
ncbi:MAG: hypothetical protein KJN99_03425 [Marinicaulis sp.]|nr:hypothetical protein [Marinicaulis sp.]